MNYIIILRKSLILGLLLGTMTGFQNCAPAKFAFYKSEGPSNNNLGNSGEDVGGTTGETGGASGNDVGGTTGDTGGTAGNDVGGTTGTTTGETGATTGTTTGETGATTGTTTGETGATTGTTTGETGATTGTTTGETGATTGTTTGETGATTGTTTGETTGGTTGNTGGTTGGTSGSTTGCEKDYPEHKRGMATAMWEDLFPNAIDADYNDFIMNFKIKEKYTRQGLDTITIDFIPKARGAGYDHSVLFIMDGKKDDPNGIPDTQELFHGEAKSIKIQYYNQNGGRASNRVHPSKSKDLVIFESTRDLFRDSHNHTVSNANAVAGTEFIRPKLHARVTIKIKDPSLNPAPAGKLDITRYRMMLFVKNTGKTIDLIDINPAHFDSNGYPYGMILPTDFKYPLESVKIDTVYNLFPQYRNYLFNRALDPNTPVTNEVLNWFDHPAPGSTGLIFHRSLFH